MLRGGVCKKERNMKTAVIAVVVAVSMLLAFACSEKSAVPSAETAALGGESCLQGIGLPLPKEESAKGYLGISGEGTFEIAQIKTDVLIIEIFSMYCPHCQREAPVVNELYQAIQGRPDLKERMKIVGVGAGNTELEVNQFREKYRISFPLVPDKYNKVAQALKVSGTPTFVGVRVQAGEGAKEFYCQTGLLGNVPEFLEKMVSLSGLKKEN
jgi:thiol-disulfide isomerase/thioredoxin